MNETFETLSPTAQKAYSNWLASENGEETEQVKLVSEREAAILWRHLFESGEPDREQGMAIVEWAHEVRELALFLELALHSLLEIRMVCNEPMFRFRTVEETSGKNAG